MSAKVYHAALKTLENKLGEMWIRLDGSYQVRVEI